MRQILADKVSGNLVHEAALCTTGVREKRSLSQNGFELVNGLPWLATDVAIHHLLSLRTVQQTQRLQVALGKLRRTLGHFAGRLLAIDPHRLRSYSKRQMRRYRGDKHSRPIKASPTFFVPDSDTFQGETFTPHWAGYATLTRSYQPRRSQAGPFWQLVQRFGERSDDYRYKAFVATTRRDVAGMLCDQFPKRWHGEEFFNTDQALGWQRAGTQNLNIRYGQMTMALVAQAVIHQFRKNPGPPYATWDSAHLAEAVFRGIEGDIRVHGDTILVTYCNAPTRTSSGVITNASPAASNPKGLTLASLGCTGSNWTSSSSDSRPLRALRKHGS